MNIPSSVNRWEENQLYGKTLTYRIVTISKRTNQHHKEDKISRKPDLYKYCENGREMRMAYLYDGMSTTCNNLIKSIIYDLKFYRAHIF